MLGVHVDVHTESHDRCSYLDLNINILNGKFYTDLCDKGDTFSFSIVNFHTWIATYPQNQHTE